MARRTTDAKEAELAGSRSLNPNPERVTDEAFASPSEFFDARDLVQVKYEMVRKVAAEGSPVARAANAFGMSRQTYYAAAEALAEEGMAGLLPAKPGPRGAHKLSEDVVDHLEALLSAEPGMRSAELAAAVAERFGILVHPRSVERALARREAARRPKRDGSSRSRIPSATQAPCGPAMRRCGKPSSPGAPTGGATARPWWSTGVWRPGSPRGPPSALPVQERQPTRRIRLPAPSPIRALKRRCRSCPTPARSSPCLPRWHWRTPERPRPHILDPEGRTDT